MSTQRTPDSGKTAQKRKRILKAAAHIFALKGYHLAKMDEIAGLAEVAKGTLYYNFASKSALFSATVTEGMDTLIGKIHAELESELPFYEHMRHLLDSFVRLYIEHGDLARILFNELSSGIEEEVLAEIESGRERFIAFITEMLAFGQKKGYVGEMNLAATAVALAGMVDTICNYHLQTGSISRDEAVDTIYRILMHGLVGEAGSR